MRRHWRTPTELLFQKPLAHHRHTIAPLEIKEPHNHGSPRPMTRSFPKNKSSAGPQPPKKPEVRFPTNPSPTPGTQWAPPTVVDARRGRARVRVGTACLRRPGSSVATSRYSPVEREGAGPLGLLLRGPLWPLPDGPRPLRARCPGCSGQSLDSTLSIASRVDRPGFGWGYR